MLTDSVDLGLPVVSVTWLLSSHHILTNCSILELRREANPTPTELFEQLSGIVHDGLESVDPNPAKLDP